MIELGYDDVQDVRRQAPDVRGTAGLIAATIEALRAALGTRTLVVPATRLTDGFQIREPAGLDR